VAGSANRALAPPGRRVSPRAFPAYFATYPAGALHRQSRCVKICSGSRRPLPAWRRPVSGPCRCWYSAAASAPAPSMTRCAGDVAGALGDALSSGATSVVVWMHLAGLCAPPMRTRRTSQRYRGAVIEPVHRDMAAAYAWADLVICRAGALTVAELAATGRPAILVPLPHAIDDHQTCQCALSRDAGAARLLPQAELDPGQRLAAGLHRPTLPAPIRRAAARWRRAALGRARPAGDADLADCCRGA
jgi:hypothetical protein